MDHRHNQQNNYRLDYDWWLDNEHFDHMHLDMDQHIVDLRKLYQGNILSWLCILDDKQAENQYSFQHMSKLHEYQLLCNYYKVHKEWEHMDLQPVLELFQ